MQRFIRQVLIRGGTLLATTTVLFVIIFHHHMRSYMDILGRKSATEETYDSRTQGSIDIEKLLSLSVGIARLPSPIEYSESELLKDKVIEKMAWIHQQGVESKRSEDDYTERKLAEVELNEKSQVSLDIKDMQPLVHFMDRDSRDDELHENMTWDILDVENRRRQKADRYDEDLTIEEINERWSWSTFDVEKESQQNINNSRYTEEELTPWIEKPMYSFDYPGKFGKPYTAENITEEEQKRLVEGWEKYQFNELVCSKIPLHRYLGDGREDACKARQWKKPLPDASVIIVIYNEAWCTLMRTIFSVLETSPKVLLKEIVLIDDASTYKNIQSELNEYVKKLKIVRLIRMKKRMGVASARMAGAKASTAQVIVFLDAHCECTKGWLEPMLERIADEPKALVSPVIEDMPYDTFSMQFRETRSVPIGVTNWDLGFGWDWQRDRPDDEPADATIKSPVVVGVSAIKRSYFFEIGGFDEELRVWGAEQLEISFKIWLCGGTLEIHPCSHVGHMHRKGFQYTPYMKDITRNNRRIAEVWMDEYKEQYYRRAPMAKFVDPGDLSVQKALRNKMHCRKFSYYLENLHPDLYAVPASDVIYWGQWASNTGKTATCFDSGGAISNPMILYPCHGLGGNQLFMLTRQGEMRLNAVHEWCMVPTADLNVSFESCIYPKSNVPHKQRWIYNEVTDPNRNATSPQGYLQHSNGLCLENIQSLTVKLKPCRKSQSQIWFYRNMPEESGYKP